MQPKKPAWAVESGKNSSVSDSSSTQTNSGLHSLENRKLEKNICHWWIWDNLQYYCESTCLHGYNFLIMDGLSRTGKLLWFLLDMVALVISFVLLWYTWNISYDPPTVTVIESTYFPTWNLPFPAVTICNFNKISKKQAYDLARRMTRPSNMTVDALVSLFPLAFHFNFLAQSSKEEYLRLHTVLKANKYSLEKFVEDISPNCDEMLLRCMFKGTTSRCDTLFQKVNSSEGVCCSFNYLGFYTNNYPVKYSTSSNEYPQRVTACGYQTGLTVLLKPMEKDYYHGFFTGTGFRVLIHDSYDYSDENAVFKLILRRSENFISIMPESTYSTRDVRSLSIKERGCYFYNEGKMNVMRRYSYVNCLAECRSKIAAKMCGCVPITLPNNGNFSVCEMDSTYCISSIQNILSSSLPGMTYAEFLKTGKRPCDCLPSCELLQYPSEISFGRLNREYSYNNLEFFRGIKLEDEVLLHVYFKDLLSTRYRTDVSQSWTSMLANVGGLLSLMIGFSILTTFEFVFYLTIRPLCNYFAALLWKKK